MTTPSPSVVATDAAHPQVAARDVVDEMSESQASATEIGVAESMFQLDSSQGLDELNFGDGDTDSAAYAEEESSEQEASEEDEAEVVAPKDKVKGKSKIFANYSEEEGFALCHAFAVVLGVFARMGVIFSVTQS
jgi:hypothetical protein